MTVAAAAFVNALEDASNQGTGCLYVADGDATRSGRVYFRDGKVYSVHVDGFMPQVGQRLRTGGMLSEEHYDALLAEVNGNAYAAHMGPLAVERDYITQDVLDAVSREILLSSIGAMFAWSQPKAKFKKNTATDQFNIPPVSVSAIVKAVTKRRDRWNELWSDIAPNLVPEATYPVLSDTFDPHSEPLSSEVAAVLSAADGASSLDTVAGVCGLTRFETGHILAHLVSNGVVYMTDAPTGAQSGTNHDSAVHGTAEVALSNGELDASETSEDTEGTYAPVDDVQPYPVAPVPETVSEPTDDAQHHAPHFAPDVLETVEHVSEEAPEQDEASAFGEVEETFPDGMDLGTIPTEQIEFDPDDPAPTSDTPPLTGLSNMQEDQTALPGIPAEAVPYTDVPYTEVGFTSAPAPLPADLPHFAEPVPPVGVAVEEPEPEAEVTPEMPPAPADAPVFVDASVLDQPRDADVPVEGMPGVPLPPLPHFMPAPMPTVPAYVEPVHEAEAVVETHAEEEEAYVADTSEYVIDDDSSENVEHDAPEQGDTDDVYAEGTPAEGDLDPYDPEADADLTHDHVTESDEDDHDMVAFAAPHAESEDPRTAHARQRLLDEINAASEAADAAESALARVEADHESHVAAAEQMHVTLDRYERFLVEAAEDQSRLNEESSAIEQERLDAEAERATVEDAAEKVAVELDKANTKVEDAREVLRKAEEALIEAEHELGQAQEAETVAAEKSHDLVVKFNELDHRAAVVSADLSEAAERVESYTAEVEDVRQMAQSVESSRDNAADLKEAAESRLVSARRSLAAKQERLAQLG